MVVFIIVASVRVSGGEIHIIASVGFPVVVLIIMASVGISRGGIYYNG